MTAPPVTLLMTVHNGGRYLRTALDSVLAQTYRAFRLLIIDDASRDDTRDIMRSYDDSRIEFVTLPRNVAQSRRLPVEPADAARPGLDPSTPPPLAGSLTSCRAQHSVRGRMSPEPMGLHKLKVIRSTIPAVTHVDGSARLQTVRHETNPLFYEIIKAFDQLTSCPVVINTSFNIRGEPIVATPEDAYRCFMRTQMDALVLESFVLTKDQQPFGALELAEAVAVGLD